MCRCNQLWGCVCVAFGLGALFGIWLESGFMTGCLGIGLILLGFGILKKK